MTHQKSTNRGFTLVELLIVIVVIAILAAISIVAYNGIQNRGKNTSAQSLASQVAKKAEAYNTVKSNYPLNVAAFADATVKEAALDGLNVVSAAPTDETEVQYTPCPSGVSVATNVTGATITYRTFPTGTASMNVGTGC